MLPLQQTDICIATRKRNINEWLQLPMRISYHCWTENLVDLQEGKLIPQYYYVSNSTKHVNTKDDYMTLHPYTTVVLLIEREVNLQLVEPPFDFNSSKCCCNVQRTFKQGSWALVL